MDYSQLDNNLLVSFFEYWFYLIVFFGFLTAAIHFIIKTFKFKK